MASIFDDNTQYPALSKVLSEAPATAPPSNTRGGLISSALSSGIDQTQSGLGSALAWAGNLLGSDTVRQMGEGIADRNAVEAARNGRSDLESFPTDDWTKVPQWALYKTIQQLPTIAAIWGTSKLPGFRAAGRVMPKSAGGIGAYVPEVLGGGGAKLGQAATFAQRRAGLEYARGIGSMTAAGYPLAVGSMYDEAREAGPVSRKEALAMGVMGVPYAAMEALQPKQLERLVTRGLAGSLPKRVAIAGLAGAAQEVPTEGVQTAMEQSFRPDLSAREKAANIVEAALTGGVVGGLLGGAGGIRRLKTVEPSKVADTDMKSTVDQALGIEPSGQMVAPGMEAQNTKRPFAGQTEEALTARLAQTQAASALDAQRQQSAFAGSTPEAVEQASTRDSMLLAQQLRAELDRRAGVAPPADAAPIADSMTRVMGQGPAMGKSPTYTDVVNPNYQPPTNELDALLAKTDTRVMGQGPAMGTSPTYQDTNNISAADRARIAELQQGPATFDPTRQFEMFAADPAAMSTQSPPTYSSQSDVRQVSEEQAASRALAKKMLGDARGKVANTLLSMPTADATDFVTNISTMLTDYAKNNAKAPAPLVKLGQQYGLLDQRGVPRDLAAELAAAQQQSELLWRRAKETGKGVKQAQEFQNKTIPKIEAQAQMLASIQQRVQQRAEAQAKAQAAQMQAATAKMQAAQVQMAAAPAPLANKSQADVVAAFTSPTSGLKLDVKQDNRAVSDGDTEWLAKRQAAASLQPDGRALKGSMTAWTTKPVELPVRALRQLPSVTPTTDSKIDRLVKRVGKVGWKPQPITVKVNHRGEAFVENGNARLIVAQGEGQRTIPVNIEWMNGAEISDTPWNPNNLYQLTQEGAMPPPAEPTSAASPENIAKLNEEGAMLKRLERIAKSDAVSRELKNKASDAAALMRDFQPGAVDNARQVLQEAKATHVTYAEGEIGPPPVGNEKLAKAAEDFKTTEDAARWLLDNTKDPFLKVILNKIAPAMERAPFYLVKAGEPVRGEIAARLNNGRVGAYLSNYTTGERGLFMRADSITEGLLTHELIHAAVNTRLYEGNLVRNKGTELAKIVGEFYDLQKVVAQAYKAMVKAGVNPEFTQMTTVQAAASSPYEFTTYAFTDPLVQDFFRAIPYQRETLWTKFVSLVRELLGIPVGQQNALTAIIDLSEQLLNTPLPSAQANLNPVEMNTVAWTDQRVEAEVQHSHYNDGRSKAWVAWVNPNDFLGATATGDAAIRGEINRKSAYYDDIQRMRGTWTPFLNVAGGKVLDHEGRHRMAALAHKGVTSVPIIINDKDGASKRQPAASMTFKPQGGNRLDVTVRDLIPLHRDYEDAIKERMSQVSVTFSEGGGYIYIVHGGSDFDQIDLRNSGRGEPGNIRPLGRGLYAYVVDPNTPDEARRAIEGARMYATKYARGDKTLHVFRVPRGVNAGWVGYHNPLPGTQLPADGRYDLRAERLPIALTEVSVLNPDVAERVAKFPLDVNVDDVLDAVTTTGGPQITYALASPQGLNEATKRLATMSDTVKGFFDKQDWGTLSLAGNKLNLYTSTMSHVAEYYGRLFQNGEKNGLKMLVDGNRSLQVAEQRLAHLTKRAVANFDELARADKDAAADVSKLASYTIFQIDPRKTLDEQPDIKSQRNADVLSKHAREANALYRRNLQIANRPANKGKVTAHSVYTDFININEAFHFAQQAISLFNIMSSDEGVLQQTKDALKGKNPMDAFLNAGDAYDTPAAARKYWFDATNELMKMAREYVDAQRGMTGRDDATTALMNRGTSAIDARIATIISEQAAMARAPYFHIGRFGNYVLRFNIRRGENGTADPTALERIAKAFEEAGIKGVEFTEGLERANAFIRFESMKARDDAFKLAQKLEKEGVIDTPAHEDRSDNSYGTDLRDAPQWVNRLINHLETTPMGGKLNIPGVDEKTMAALNAELVNHVQQYFLNMLPDIAVNKVMVHRNSVPGFSSDMIRSFVHRTNVGGHAIANMYASAKLAEATTEMLQVAKDARTSDDPKAAQVKMNVVTEMFKRVAQRPMLMQNDFVDMVRAFNHAYFLGFSPSHFIVNTTQLGVLLWPELSKKHSFVSSAKAIGRATPQAIRIISEVLKTTDLKHLPDASITRQILKDAKVDDKTAEFVMRVVNSGLLDIGSQSRELGRIAEGRNDSKVELALRWASTTGYYSEMLTRLIAALSARDLHGDKPGLNDYVDETVRQSMLQYETWNQARATGKMGLAGQMTPIMTSFMQYQFQVTEKMYRELHKAFIDKAATPQEKKAAKHFLAAHLAAVTTVAGSLGLPMAAVFAGVFDRLADLFGDDDDEPMNIQAAYREWLATMLGKDAAEIVARGLPRAIGVDVSSRAGEQNFLPFGHMFSRLLTDRRDWQDKIGEWALDTMGSPVSMASNIIMGGGQFLSGDFLQGMQTAVPNSIKGPFKAFTLTDEGYVDGKGNKMPMTAGALDQLVQALGFTPAQKAEYAEARGVQQTLRSGMISRASDIRNRLISALESNDMATARDAYSEALRFDRANPSFEILPGISSVIASRRKEATTADRMNAPLGVKPALASRTDWANFGN